MTEQEQDESFKKSLELIEKWGEQNKPPTLWEILRNNLGYSIDTCEEIIDVVDNKWLPREYKTSDYKWNQCIKMMREKLR